MAKTRRTEDVPSITTAPGTPGAELAHRQRRYVISMTIRTFCFIGAVFAQHIVWLWPTLIAAAFFLPYIAVVMANSVSPRLPGSPIEDPGRTHEELE